MSAIKLLFRSSVGKKFIVGLTGIGLVLFAISHMAANLLIVINPEAFNGYGHAMTSNKAFYYTAETFLFGMFIIHISLAIKLALENKTARPTDPSRLPKDAKLASFASRSMIFSGLILLVFLILHLKTFRFGVHYPITYDGVEMRDLYRLTLEVFSDPIYAFGYIFAMLVLGLHLSHGVSAVFQSLGVAASNESCLRKVALTVAVVLAVGFMTAPIAIFFCGGSPS